MDGTLTQTGVNFLAPGDVPDGITLTLQLKSDDDSSYTDYQTGVAAGQTVVVAGLEACSWFVARWLAVPGGGSSSSL